MVHIPPFALRTPEPENPGDASMRAHEGGQLREERERRVRTPLAEWPVAVVARFFGVGGSLLRW